MAEFTSTYDILPTQSCDHCHTLFDHGTTPFIYIKGINGSGQNCCPSYAEHYRHKINHQPVKHASIGM